MHAALRLMAALGAVAAPALFAQMTLAQSSQAQSLPAPAYAPQAPSSVTAGALPPPPYAQTGEYGQPSNERRAGPTYDRYGGGAVHYRSLQPRGVDAPGRTYAEAAAPPAYAGPRLSWSGKVDAAPAAPRPTAAYARYASAPQAPIAPRASYGAPPAPQPPAPPEGWSYVPPIGQAPSAAPRSIYDTPPAATAPAPTQQAPAQPTASAARHYSVHREYGAEPDPIPLPPQFFGATADLTQPETADPARRTVTGNGKSHNAIQPTDGQ
jgi:hypothetical protein